MTRCAIMQPTYLPWSGYFALMSAADIFVFLDDVQFARNTWQSMNRVLGEVGPVKLIVPVEKQPLQEKIENIRIDYGTDWVARHKAQLLASYGGSAHAAGILRVLFSCYDKRPELLAELNIDLILGIAAHIGIATTTLRASELGCGGRRSEHVALICRAVGADHYVSPEGARDYLAEDRFVEQFGIPLSFQSFEPGPYDQGGRAEFVSHLSMIDVICSVGPEATRRYVSSDRTG